MSMRNRELGRRLRWAQERAGLNGTQLADVLGWTQTALSRTLSGRRETRDVDVAAFLAVCRVTGDERDNVLRLCRPGQETGALRLADGEQWSAYLAHAGTALRLIEFQPFTVPWMVQTPDYTRTLLADALDEQIRARRAAVSLVRLPHVTLFLHEWLFRTPVQDAEMMSEQLHHLLRMSVRPELSIRVVPAGHSVRACAGGPFSLLDFADHPPVVYREDHAAGAFIDQRAEVDACRSVTDHLDRVAFDEEDSRRLIADFATSDYAAMPLP